MSDLLKIYEDMQKVAEADEVKKQRLDVIVKYATLAEEMLEEKFDDKYGEEDVIKVAEFLIDSDLEAEAEQEKVAEYDQLGRIMARAYLDEMAKVSEEK